MEEPRRWRKKSIDHIICEVVIKFSLYMVLTIYVYMLSHASCCNYKYMQCADCGRRGTIGIRRQLAVPLRSGVEKTVMLLECDGLVPLDGEVGTDFQWTAISDTTRKKFYCNEKNHYNNIRVIAIVDTRCCNKI